MTRRSAAALLFALAATDGAAAVAASAAFAAPPSSGGRVGTKTGTSAAVVGRCQVGSAFLGRGMSLRTCSPKKPAASKNARGGSTELKAFLGDDGGILGVGAPEVAVIVLVGYFVLGPSDLYKLVKEIGKTIQNVRTLGTEATKTFESTMEDQLEIEELRKAQQELTDAFSFRRSINVDEDTSFYEGSAQAEAEAAAEAAAATAAAATATATVAATATADGAPPKKRKMKRRRKKKVAPPPEEEAIISNVPDLDMTDAFAPVRPEPAEAPVAPAPSPVPVGSPEAGSADWFDEQRAVPDEAKGLYDTPVGTGEADNAFEQDRFATQLSGNWNQQILDNEDVLSPLSKVMERLAILEEEKRAADMRLEEEFRMKAELEEKFYEKKRKLLEEAAAEVQADAYASMAESASNKTEVVSNKTEAKSTV